MRKWISILLVVVSPSLAASDSAIVRAGEHPTFTRLVVDISPNAEWDIKRNNDGYDINIPNAGDFDTSVVFDRIPTTRVSSLESVAEGGGLKLGTNCDCHVTAFKWRADKLVVDINDGPGKKDSPFEARMAPQTQALPLMVLNPPRDFQISVPTEKPEEIASQIVEQNALSALEKIVVESLARGASQGLLSPAKKLSMPDGISSAADAQTILADGLDQPGLLAHTSIDLGKVGAEDPLQTSDAQCQSSNFFAVSEWGSNSGLYGTIAPLRENLTGELGEPDHDAINQLARAYLHFGFGREAKGILSLDDENSQERMVLEAMASVIDGDTLETDVFSEQIDCNGPSAFWAFLSREAGSAKKGNRDAILNTFRNLPIALQSHFAPRLSKRFLDVGDPDAAEMAFSIENFVESGSIESRLAKADLQSAIGSEGDKVASLDEMIENDTRMTPEALLEFFRLSMEAGAQIDDDIMALAEILRFENAGSSLEVGLATAQVDAYLANGSEAAAFDLLSEVEELIPTDVKNELEAKAIRIAASTRNVEGFLDLAFSEIVKESDPATQNIVVKRLLEIGLAERATVLLGSDAIGDAMMERRYLRAEAALELGNFEEAIQQIAGLSTERANVLREQTSASAEQSDILDEVSIGDDWRQGNWARLSVSDDPLLQSVSNSILENTLVNEAPDEPLAYGRELIAQSEKTRALLDEVLDRYTPVSQ